MTALIPRRQFFSQIQAYNHTRSRDTISRYCSISHTAQAAHQTALTEALQRIVSLPERSLIHYTVEASLGLDIIPMLYGYTCKRSLHSKAESQSNLTREIFICRDAADVCPLHLPAAAHRVGRVHATACVYCLWARRIHRKRERDLGIK